MNKSDDTISRQAAIDAVCAVCGNDCDKSEFVYNAPQDEQVILCPEHYCLCTLPSADRPRGEWIFNPKDAIELMFTKPKCSECGFESSDGGNYCFNCGARMVREDGEEE